MRIAWTGPVAEGGGVSGMGLIMLQELLSQGVAVDVYMPAYATMPSPLAPAPGLRIIVRRSNWAWGRWYSRTKVGALFSGMASRTLSSFILGLRLLVEHRRRPYDAVYQLSQTELFLLGRLRRFAPPLVVHPCTHAAGELRWLRSEADYARQSEARGKRVLILAWQGLRSRIQPSELARADLVVGLSERFNQHLVEDYGVPREKLAVVRTAVDLERFEPGDTIRVPAESAGSVGSSSSRAPRTILFVSRISARKGVEEVVQLSHRLADLVGAVRLVVVGGPTQWSDYRAHLSRLHPEIAEYVGPLDSEDLAARMREAALLLVPSRYEPGSITTAEALACGLPVVLSDEVGNAEAVTGPHVRFHRPGDVDSLEAAVRSLLAAVEVDERALRMAARANAEAEFAPQVVVRRLIEAISSLPTSGTAPGARPRPTTHRAYAQAR